MNLDEFVEETLTAILAGIANARKGEHGKKISGPVNVAIDPKKGFDGILTEGGRNHTVVQFDVAVTTQTSGAAKGAIKVLGIGSGGADLSRASEKFHEFGSASLSRSPALWTIDNRAGSSDQLPPLQRLDHNCRISRTLGCSSKWPAS